ncbi:hypothetical protein Q8A67_019727 [Cirrhinus molitorella]|uniref:Uncharacterized protein n=1 Tax=Cirrhinus molitorella TaxID=172907 RepID=A0AA88TGL7_9TELE|nr:hypothetical protein Q8A67_019727 [Cirrhinus molitorella]
MEHDSNPPEPTLAPRKGENMPLCPAITGIVSDSVHCTVRLCARTSCLSPTGWKGWKIADFPEEQTVPAGPIKAICSVRPCLSAPPSSGKTSRRPPPHHRTPAPYRRPMARVPKVPGPVGPP